MFRISIFTTVLTLLFILNAKAQLDRKTVYKEYTQTPLPSLNEGSKMILYKDSTFLNFGILKDVENQEIYVWFANGKWKLQNGSPVFVFLGTPINKEQSIKEIKSICKERIDYRMINNYYEFVFENGSQAVLFIEHDELIDSKKKLNYKELSGHSYTMGTE